MGGKSHAIKRNAEYWNGYASHLNEKSRDVSSHRTHGGPDGNHGSELLGWMLNVKKAQSECSRMDFDLTKAVKRNPTVGSET